MSSWFEQRSGLAGTVAAVEQFGRTLAVELGPDGIRVNNRVDAAPRGRDVRLFGLVQVARSRLAQQPAGRGGTPPRRGRRLIEISAPSRA
jgi:NAD(P)-dependent dehydrogenase (short-subunit alcohol dehydrogenase family)